MTNDNAYKLSLAVCSLCKHSIGAKCRLNNRHILKDNKLNVVDCSHLREIMSLADGLR